MSTPAPSASILVIGDEILSGRTQDVNVREIARLCSDRGIDLKEVRIVGDDTSAIIDAVNTLRHRFTYLFTTGGIGPTHDDITAEAIANAFEVPFGRNAEAFETIKAAYEKSDRELTPARAKMADMPDGVSLIPNPVSGAPGFRLDNVFVLAGVPAIVRGMLEHVGPQLQGGTPVHSVSVRAEGLREGDLAADLSALEARFDGVNLGSYPWFDADGFGVNLIARGRDASAVAEAGDALEALVRQQGQTPERS